VGLHQRILVPARLARRPQRGDDVIRRFCGETVEVHAEPMIGPKNGPCGANDCMSRTRAPNGPPSLVKHHSPDHDTRPDVLPIFFCFVICGVCRSTTSAHFSGRVCCGLDLFPPRCVSLAATGTACRIWMVVVADVILRVFAVLCCPAGVACVMSPHAPARGIAVADMIAAVTGHAALALSRSRCASSSITRRRLSSGTAMDATA